MEQPPGDLPTDHEHDTYHPPHRSAHGTGATVKAPTVLSPWLVLNGVLQPLGSQPAEIHLDACGRGIEVQRHRAHCEYWHDPNSASELASMIPLKRRASFGELLDHAVVYGGYLGEQAAVNCMYITLYSSFHFSQYPHITPV